MRFKIGSSIESYVTAEAIASELMMAKRFSACGGCKYDGGDRCRQPLAAEAALHDTSAALCTSWGHHHHEAWLQHVLVLSERTQTGGDEPLSCPNPDECRWKQIPTHMLQGVKRVARSVGRFRKCFATWLRRSILSFSDQESAIQSSPDTDVEEQQSSSILDMRMELPNACAKAGESFMFGLYSVNLAASPAVTTVDLLDFNDTNSVKDSLSDDGQQSADALSFRATAETATSPMVLLLPRSLFSFTPSASCSEEQRSRAPSNDKASARKVRSLRHDTSWLCGPCSGVRDTPSFSPARPWTTANAPDTFFRSLDSRYAPSMPAHSGSFSPSSFEACVLGSVGGGSSKSCCAVSDHGHGNGTGLKGDHQLPAAFFLVFLPQWRGPVQEVQLLCNECGADGNGRRPGNATSGSQVRIELSPMA
ncbi:hypothetical protein Vretimale_17177 [Volvox reticuliferus]|uniref:Uncharacterized protein n=1 Tax=Volvox reticuliferus TaxID=1737510 RepID=A0A8J4CXF4_9CHLO|nr:hypothetical protein Vretifemale_18570 [Volvox reticuliferus]GIM14174.1 hypothetical protein Vretimale_17177 [Volvox reticuliferus]